MKHMHTLSDVEHSERCFDILMLYRYIASNGIPIYMPSLLSQSDYNLIVNNMFINIEWEDLRTRAILERTPSYVRGRTYVSYFDYRYQDRLDSIITSLPSKFIVEYNNYHYLIWIKGTGRVKSECIYVINGRNMIYEINNLRQYEIYYNEGLYRGYYSSKSNDDTILDIERKERAAWDSVDKPRDPDNFSQARDAFRRGFYDGYYSPTEHSRYGNLLREYNL